MPRSRRLVALATAPAFTVLVTACGDTLDRAVACSDESVDIVWVDTETAQNTVAGSPHANRVGFETHEVTNRRFAAFVAATGYVTLAERRPANALVRGSAVFKSIEAGPGSPWWAFVPGASWRAPEGPGSTIRDRMDHPVVHIARADALAYAQWVGGDLPTAVEWQAAALALHDTGKHGHAPQAARHSNHWQGFFPFHDDGTDGFTGTAPVGCFPANPAGLFDMTGNAWEWVRSEQPDQPGHWGEIRGGSFLCSENFCANATPFGQEILPPDTSASHIGFRVVYR